MERINVRVDAGLKRQIEVEARDRGVSPSEVVREAIAEHVRRRKPRENCYELAVRLGILGVYKDAPPDLSTNPAHMEGFGLD